ncbi:MAG: glycosyltransferase family 2 protein [Candidatus Rokuibacteriota bacterium]
MSRTAPAVAVIVVNWNGWVDTLECLESVLRSAYPDYRIVVCDNASPDGSMDRIKAWAEGRLDVAVAPRDPLRWLSFPPVAKPIAYREAGALTAGADRGDADREPRLVLVHTGGNRGFAAGVNVGLRYALARPQFGYAWLLNNDAVVDPHALSHLVRRMQARLEAGMCGSTVRYYHAPEMIQALGGATYNRWLGATRHVGMGQTARPLERAERVERQLAYILGASLLVSRSFLEDVGLMNEDYFLFFEELDWAIRGRGRYTLAYAPESLVYHKEGASLGTSPDPYRRSLAAEYFHVRNRLRLTRRFYPFALPTVYLGVAASLLKRLREGQWDKARIVIDGALGRRWPATRNGGPWPPATCAASPS